MNSLPSKACNSAASTRSGRALRSLLPDRLERLLEEFRARALPSSAPAVLLAPTLIVLLLAVVVLLRRSHQLHDRRVHSVQVHPAGYRRGTQVVRGCAQRGAPRQPRRRPGEKAGCAVPGVDAPSGPGPRAAERAAAPPLPTDPEPPRPIPPLDDDDPAPRGGNSSARLTKSPRVPATKT